MQSVATTVPGTGTQSFLDSRAAVITGRVLSGAAIAFLLFDGTLKLLQIPGVIEASARLGVTANQLFAFGILTVVSTLLYVVPGTSVLGLVLLTGYLGGAVFAHVRVGDPLFTHVLFPVYVATFAWGGLFLRDRRVRALLPLRQRLDPSA